MEKPASSAKSVNGMLVIDGYFARFIEFHNSGREAGPHNEEFEKMKRSTEVGDFSNLSRIHVSDGVFMRPSDAATYEDGRELKTCRANRHEVESSGPKVKKLWPGIDEYHDLEEAHNISTTERKKSGELRAAEAQNCEFRRQRGAEYKKTTSCYPKTYENRVIEYDKDYQTFRCGNSSGSKENDSIRARDRIKKTVRHLRAICKELLQEGKLRRVDYEAARIVKGRPDYLDLGKPIGPIPGVEIGDEFYYRMEVAVVGLHKPPEAGIDFTKHGADDICISIVSIESGDYANDMQSVDSLIYCGHGGTIGRTRKEPEDQRLVGGNLAMKNSITVGNPVRVIRGKKETRVKGKVEKIYIYDGLYVVETFWQEEAPCGKLVFKFKLRRIPGQPRLTRNQWRKLRRF